MIGLAIGLVVVALWSAGGVITVRAYKAWHRGEFFFEAPFFWDQVFVFFAWVPMWIGATSYVLYRKVKGDKGS